MGWNTYAKVLRGGIAYVLLTGIAAHAQNVIATFAGGNSAFTGAGQPATSIFLEKVSAVSLDPSGNPVFALRFRNVVLRLNPDGTVTVLAGTGQPGFAANGLKATAAPLNGPEAAAYDSSGNLYIADTLNNRVLMVSGVNGTVSAFAGTGAQGYFGENVPATQAVLNGPTGVAVDALNNVYIVDEANRLVRKVVQGSGTIATVVGNGQNNAFQPNQTGPNTSLGDPSAMAFDRNGDLFVADFAWDRVLRVDAVTGLVTNVAGTGSPGSASENASAAVSPLTSPGGVAVDQNGVIYVAETNNSKIRKIVGGLISTYAGNDEFGFSGDGGPAISASMNAVFGLAVDSMSNLYLADRDNFRVRRVDSVHGTISTVAGNGTSFDNNVPASSLLLSGPFGVTTGADGSVYISDTNSDVVRRVTPGGQSFTVGGTGAHGYAGDHGLATDAELASPYATALDSAGNLYIADYGNQVVRKVDTTGVITTIAGTGMAGYNEDGIQATEALLNGPAGVAIGSDGYLYIADSGNNRIRRVANGVIATAAGTGSPAILNTPFGLAADSQGNIFVADALNDRVLRLAIGGAAAGTLTTVGAGQAQGVISGVAVDSAGNVYFSDAGNNVVEQIGSGGKIVVRAGTGKLGAGGDGGSATQAQLNAPVGLAVDAGGNIFIADEGNDKVRVVYAAAPSFEAVPNPMTFSAPSGGLTVSQSLTLNSAVAGLPFTIALSSPNNWLTLSAPSGEMPATITVTADPSQLSASPSNATLLIDSPFAATSVQQIPVSFAISAPLAPIVSVETPMLNFSFPRSGSASSRSVQIHNGGGGKLLFSVSQTTGDGGSWLHLSSQSGTATIAQPFPLTVTVDPSSLMPGSYAGIVTVTDTAGSDSSIVAVNVTVSNAGQTMVLSQTGLTFTAVQGGGPAPVQTIEVLNNGAGNMGWQVAAPNVGWLSLTNTAGTSAAGVTPTSIGVQVNPGGMSPGVYYGQITISSSTATNSPLQVPVVLNLLGSTQDPGPVALPSGLIFVGTVGGSTPAPQTVTVYNLSTAAVVMGSSRTFVGTGNWFVHDIINATVPPAVPLVITVTPQIAGLKAGVYQAALTLAFSDGAIRTIAIRLILAASSSVSSANIRPSLQTSGCTPTTLVPVFTSVAQGFSLTAAWPQEIAMQVADDCGNPMTAGSLVVSFSNNDIAQPLVSLLNGSWKGTWTPAHVTSSLVLTGNAQIPPSLKGTITQQGGVLANTVTPSVPANGVISATNGYPGGPLSPGEYITIYGQQLAGVILSNPAPFPTTLGNVQVSYGGELLPLELVSPTQINAVIPYDLKTNVSHVLVVNNENATSATVEIPLADSLPTIFTMDQTGHGQAAITDAYSGIVFNSSNPASAGSIASIYCTGLGAVNVSGLTAGTPAPTPAAMSVGPLTVTVGGQPAEVLFQGLSPGYAGLYQINIVIPDGVTPSGAVPVVLNAGGRVSPTVTIAVQ